jgi:hypothetical protein
MTAMGADPMPPEVTVLSVAPGASASLQGSEARLIGSALHWGNVLANTPVVDLLTKLNRWTGGRLGGKTLALLDACHDVQFWRARQDEKS